MPPSDKIKRAILWMRKVLEIKDPGTTQPGSVSGQILPTIDTFGWDRYPELQIVRNSGTNTTTATGTAPAEGFNRLIVNASVHVDNGAIGFLLWLGILQDGSRCGVIRPFDTGAGAGIPFPQVGLSRPILLAPGQQMTGHCQPASGVGQLIILTTRFVDIPIGEYVPPT